MVLLVHYYFFILNLINLFNPPPHIFFFFSFTLKKQNSSKSNYPPTPMYMSKVLLNPEDFRCLPDANDDGANWNQKTSPWSTPQNCVWPVDTSDQRICSTEDQFGNHKCSKTLHKYCGSNFDMFGNPRFINNNNLMDLTDNYIPELNYGYTTFDHLPVAFLTIFQCVTEEGWVDIMYQIQDGFNGLAGAIVFILLLVFGSFLLLNLTLAVLEDALSAQKGIEEEKQEEAEKELELSQDLDGSDNKEKTEDSEETKPPNQGWRVPIYNLVTNPWFDLFIIILIIITSNKFLVLSIEVCFYLGLRIIHFKLYKFLFGYFGLKLWIHLM